MPMLVIGTALQLTALSTTCPSLFNDSNDGARSGIGLETVAGIAQVSADYHILLGARSLEKGNCALREIKSTYSDLKSTISVLQLAVASREIILDARDDVEKTHGRVDVLMNNAGILIIGARDGLEVLRASTGRYRITEAGRRF
ncbi:hypothetical protein BJ170DRAFT_595283 [Xylariales sp. AK1849]|nr:hypothetical protein BJ170DRAFT_595283 [Xylariales sp. AK1849]